MGAAKSPPPQIPGFTFAQSIGAGGFADVFLFTQHSTGRAVAVKVLRAEHLSERSLGQFETEANVMAGVSAHPFIVTIHDAGVAPDGRPYLVMEHYPQPHFGQRAAGGRLPLAEVLKVAIQVSSAVETAHRADILHRDIKPANILTSAFGDPGLTDFGIAGVQTDGEMSAASGVSMGFTAPEVVFDESATGSRESDVYGLGATVYALLTGRSPIYVPGGDNSHGSLAIRLERGEVLPVRRDDLPRSLDLLLHSALSPRPDQRPSTAETFARALQDIEQQLHLAPTNLVLLDGHISPEVSRPETDEDGTRRRPRVIDLDGGEPPAASAPPVDRPRSTDGANDLESVQATGQTIRRGTATPPPGPAPTDTIARGRKGTTPEPGPAPDQPATRTFPVVPVAVAAAALVVLVAIATVLTSGGESDAADDAAPATRPSTVPDLAIGPASIAPPGQPTLTVGADGNLTLAWSAPGDLRDDQVATYTVYRMDGPVPDPIAETTELTATLPAAILQTSADPDGVICFMVQARVLDTVSDAEVCHRSAPPASVPQP